MEAFELIEVVVESERLDDVLRRFERMAVVRDALDMMDRRLVVSSRTVLQECSDGILVS